MIKSFNTPKNIPLLITYVEYLAACLQYPGPSCNTRIKQHSTILVSQYKLKFNNARIYCDLANEILVEEKAKQLRVEATDNFKFDCLIEDSIRYRKCYFDIIQMISHLPEEYFKTYTSGLLSTPDYFELLDFKSDNPKETFLNNCDYHYIWKDLTQEQLQSLGNKVFNSFESYNQKLL